MPIFGQNHPSSGVDAICTPSIQSLILGVPFRRWAAICRNATASRRLTHDSPSHLGVVSRHRSGRAGRGRRAARLPAAQAGRGEPDRSLDQGQPHEGAARQRARGHIHLDGRARSQEARPELLGARPLPRQPGSDALLGRPPAGAAALDVGGGQDLQLHAHALRAGLPVRGRGRGAHGPRPYPGRGERPALKGEDKGFREYKVATLELLPQTENIFPVYKEGWHNPETHPENPSVERVWTKKEALMSFKNPKQDVIVYLEGDTCVKCFTKTPEAHPDGGEERGPGRSRSRARRSTSRRSR